MKIVRTLFLAVLCIALLCSCGVKGKGNADNNALDTENKTASKLNIAAQLPSVNASTRILRGNGYTALEYLPLPALFDASTETLREASNSRMLLTPNSDSQYLPEGIKKGIKITTNGQEWAQALVATNESGKEGMLIDPCPDSLEGYDGLYIWLDVRPRVAGQVIPNEFVIMLFNWDFGYRDMFEYSFKIPEGGFVGYVKMPFSEFVNGYDQNQKYCAPAAIDGIGFRMNAPDKMSFLDIYVADLQAYREIFW